MEELIKNAKILKQYDHTISKLTRDFSLLVKKVEEITENMKSIEENISQIVEEQNYFFLKLEKKLKQRKKGKRDFQKRN